MESESARFGVQLWHLSDYIHSTWHKGGTHSIFALAVFAVPVVCVIIILWVLYLVRLQPVVCGCLWDVSFRGDKV